MMRQRHYVIGALVALGLAYLIQLESPLRLNTDATSFLTMAASFRDGNGFLINGRPTHFPAGYPLILAGLEAAGVGCSAGIIGVNLAMLGLGLAATAYVLTRAFQFDFETVGLIGVLTLLCWVFVKHATLPLSDVPYFGLAMSALAVLTWSRGQASWSGRLTGITLAALFAFAAIEVRTVGIALIPAIAGSCLPRGAWEKLPGWARAHPGRTMALAVAVLVTVAAGSILIARTRYVREMHNDWRGWDVLMNTRLEDWGELAINTSVAQLPRPVGSILGPIGAVAALFVCWGALKRFRFDVVDNYAACYAGILFFWPYRDARFWMPIFPIVAAYCWVGYRALADRPWVRSVGRIYVAGFVAMGLVALVYSSRLSLAGDRFPELYGGGVYRHSYAASAGKRLPDADERKLVDVQLVRLIQRYASGG
jgi:hypothetical protein